MKGLATAHDASVQMIDTSIFRVHQHAACITRNRRQSRGRSRGGLTSKVHAVVDDTNGLTREDSTLCGPRPLRKKAWKREPRPGNESGR